MSTKFQLISKIKIPTNEEVSCLKSLRCCIYLAINVKMPTIVGILTFMSRITFVLSRVEREKYFITSGPGLYIGTTSFKIGLPLPPLLDKIFIIIIL